MPENAHHLVPEDHESRREFEEAEGIFPETPSPIGFPEGDGEPMVWLAHPAEDRRRHHGVVVLARGDELAAFEIAMWAEEKPIDRLFAIAGYAPSRPPATTHGRVDLEAQALVPVMGFRVPAARLGAVTARMEEAMAGRTGGFAALVLGQLGFHQAHTAFLAAWEAADRPPVEVRQPQWVTLGAGSGAPMPLALALQKHLGHGASLGYWEGRPLFDDEPTEGENP
ncbi:MAG: hypothetical protein FJ096_14185 [Deltaproteobacteria bacterium]|nr:hypothetical protein [Deltaproteobacteria bacterium]